MARDPYADFSDEVPGELPDNPAPSAPADDAYSAFADLSQEPGRPANAIARNEFDFEVEQMLRRGASPDAVRRFAGSVVDADTGTAPNFPNPADLEAAADYYRRGGSEPLNVRRELLGPDGRPSTRAGAMARGVGDTLLLNSLDEIEAFVETGSFSGPEYEEAWGRRQQRRAADDPTARGAGQALGIVGSMAVPVGALGRVAGMGKQMLTGATVGGGMSALAGAGAASPGQRTENLDRDFAGGALFGAAAPPLATVARKAAQVVGVNPQSGADDIFLRSGLNPAELRARADQYFERTGQGARIMDLIEPATDARVFTAPLARSEAARSRVLRDLESSQASLPETMGRRVVTGPTPPPGEAPPDPRVIIGPEGIRQQVRAQGDRDFSAFRDAPVTLQGPDLVYFSEQVFPNLKSLGRPVRDRITEAFTRADGGQVTLTAGDLDLVRRALGKQARSRPGEGFKELKEGVEEILSSQIPDAAKAIQRYGAGMRTVEGAELGREALNPRGTVDFREQLQTLDKPGRVGVTLGARSGVLNEVTESPGKAYAFAARLENDPGLQARLRDSMGPEEAQDLINFAIAQKQSIDALVSAARIPPDKIETLLNSTEEMTDALVAIGLGAGGAFKAGLANSILARTNIGRGAADKLAEDLLNPARRERVIRLLERAGLPKTGLRQILQGFIISAGNQILTADRVPEGAPIPDERLSLEAPLQ